MNPNFPSYGLNSTTAVLLEVWLWHYITHEGSYAIKQRNPTQTLNWKSDEELKPYKF